MNFAKNIFEENQIWELSTFSTVLSEAKYSLKDLNSNGHKDLKVRRSTGKTFKIYCSTSRNLMPESIKVCDNTVKI